jgi:hypothetical protein
MSSPSPQEYLDASNAVYSHAAAVPSSDPLHPELTALLNSNLQPVMSESDADGFYAEAYVDGQGNIIVAYEGSDLNPTDDLQQNSIGTYARASQAADIELASGHTPAALVDALIFAQEVNNLAGSDPIYVTGHSLGGAEAENAFSLLGYVQGGATFGAPGLPGYSGPASDPLFIDYVDYGDPVGNDANDSNSELQHDAQVLGTGSHFGTVEFLGTPEQASLLQQANSGFLANSVSLLDLAAELYGQGSVDHLLSNYALDLRTTINGSLAPTQNPSSLLNVITKIAAPSTVLTPPSVAGPHPVITGPSNIPATTNTPFFIAPYFPASESPVGSGHQVAYYSVFVVSGSGSLVVNNHSYGLGSTATNVSPAEFATVTFSPGANPGVDEIAVIAFDDAGTSSIAADTTITVSAPATTPQPISTTDHTPPTIVAPSQQLVTGVGSAPNLISAYLSVTDANSAHYTPAQLTYTIVSAPSHGYIVKGGSIVSSFTQADINNGLIEYQENGTVASSDSVTYYVSDPAGNRTVNTAFSVTINTLPESTHPTLDTDSTLSVGQGQTALITDSNLHVTDSGLSSWRIIYTVTGGDTHGQILADGISIVHSFTQQQVDLGLISYQNTGNLSGPDNLTFTVSDSEGGTIGQNTLGINVIPKDNLSVTANRPLFTDPEGQFILHINSGSGFPITDLPGFTTYTNTPGHVSLLSSDVLSSLDPGVDPSNITYTVVSMPTNAGGFLIGTWGTPESESFTPFNGYTIAPTDISNNFVHTFTQAQVDAGEVFYQQINEIGNGQEHYGEQFSVQFSASDNAGNVISNISLPLILDSHGLLTDGNFYEAGSSIPDVQIAAPIGATTTVGSGALTYISTQFSDSQTTWWVSSLPQYGTLLLSGTPLSVHATFTQEDIDTGRFAYVENGLAVTSDQFVLGAWDPNSPDNPQVVFTVDVRTTGTAGGQSLAGSSGAETLSPGIGNNFLFGDGNTTVSYANSPNGVSVNLTTGTVANGYGGTDTLTDVHSFIGSSAGTNTVTYDGKHTDYSFAQLSGGGLQVTDLRSGAPDGVDQYQSFQTFVFADGAYTPSQLLDTIPPTLMIISAGVLTNQTTQTVSGTIDAADAGLAVSIYDGTALLGTVTPAGNGTWSKSVTLLSAQGAQAITAQATDAAGNVGTSGSVAYTLDTIAPSLAISSTGGSTNQTSQTVSGTIDAADAGLTVSIFDDATLLGTVTPAGNGTWSKSVTLLSTQGAQTITAQATDAAGNIGTSNIVTYTLDTTPPLVQDSLAGVAIGTARTISQSQLHFADNVSADAQEIYRVIKAPADGTLLNNGIVTSSFTQADIDNGAIVYQETGSGATSDAFTFTVTDAAGNSTAAQSFQIDIMPVPDMVMRDVGSGAFEFYAIANNQYVGFYAMGQVGPEWQVAGFGGFSGNANESDMLMRSSAGAFELYDIYNNQYTGFHSLGQVGLEWQVAGFGDFGGNSNETDMLMRSSSGAFELYDISNNQYAGFHSLGQVGPEWQVAGFGDFSGNANETDMLMRSSTGAFELYDISNNQYTGFYSLGQVGPEWQVAGFGDFSGNANETDMLMRNGTTGAFEIYDITNNQYTGFYSLGQVGPEWQVAGFGDFSGNANETDMLMRNAAGAFELYDISNNQYTGFHSLGQVGPEWQVAGISNSATSASQLTQAVATFAPNSSVSSGSNVQMADSQTPQLSQMMMTPPAA